LLSAWAALQVATVKIRQASVLDVKLMMRFSFDEVYSA
jgi:hypothetical protein